MEEKLSITDPRRIKARDDKLWVREKKKAAMYGFPRIHCPCTLHNGTGHCFNLDEVERHLYRHGRSPDCRTWRGPEDPDSSDEEWENQFTMQNAQASRRPRERDNGVQIRTMLQHIYQEVENIAETEERLDEAIMDALEASDNIINGDGEENAQSAPDAAAPDEHETNNTGDCQNDELGSDENGRARPEVCRDPDDMLLAFSVTIGSCYHAVKFDVAVHIFYH